MTLVSSALISVAPASPTMPTTTSNDAPPNTDQQSFTQVLADQTSSAASTSSPAPATSTSASTSTAPLDNTSSSSLPPAGGTSPNTSTSSGDQVPADPSTTAREQSNVATPRDATINVVAIASTTIVADASARARRVPLARAHESPRVQRPLPMTPRHPPHRRSSLTRKVSRVTQVPKVSPPPSLSRRRPPRRRRWERPRLVFRARIYRAKHLSICHMPAVSK